MLATILQPINQGVGKPQLPVFTFKGFVDSVYLPVYRGKWKASTTMTEELRVQVHLVGELGSQLMAKIDRDALQRLLNRKAKVLARGGVDHLRFRLRSIFTLAVSEGVVQRNPAVSLFTPRKCKESRKKLVLTPEDINRIMNVFDLGSVSWFGLRRSKACGQARSSRFKLGISTASRFGFGDVYTKGTLMFRKRGARFARWRSPPLRSNCSGSELTKHRTKGWKRGCFLR
jgi:hypothetical protein